MSNIEIEMIAFIKFIQFIIYMLQMKMEISYIWSNKFLPQDKNIKVVI